MVTATEPAAIKENRESYQETVQVNIFEGLPEAFKTSSYRKCTFARISKATAYL